MNNCQLAEPEKEHNDVDVKSPSCQRIRHLYFIWQEIIYAYYDIYKTAGHGI